MASDIISSLMENISLSMIIMIVGIFVIAVVTLIGWIKKKE